MVKRHAFVVILLPMFMLLIGCSGQTSQHSNAVIHRSFPDDTVQVAKGKNASPTAMSTRTPISMLRPTSDPNRPTVTPTATEPSTATPTAVPTSTPTNTPSPTLVPTATPVPTSTPLPRAIRPEWADNPSAQVGPQGPSSGQVGPNMRHGPASSQRPPGQQFPGQGLGTSELAQSPSLSGTDQEGQVANEVRSNGNTTGCTEIPDLDLILVSNNYSSSYGTKVGVYIMYTDISGMTESRLRQELKQISAWDLPLKMVAISSLPSMQLLIQDMDQELKAAGVNTIGYNMEGDRTPGSERSAVGQSVAEGIRLAHDNGYCFMWGPTHRILQNNVTASDIQTVLDPQNKLDAVAFQEQKFVSNPGEANWVKQMAAKFPGVHVSAQIMPSGCPSTQKCAQFVRDIADSINSLGIWATGSDRSALPSSIPVWVNALHGG